ncbi:c-type cytochrome [Loktanella sp. SALINAS62]|uniref:cytochrome c oxidase subunit II n=1 Tax=Loktanella sp. SALINAS62 TaxID=2706124 RepID=UPI001B8B0306|nr:c-type cytochrome [Loktanella sp. SALINAS62]MBS1303316.1 c-type cytochrome [Loktanella sp. SALINAS62]
MTDKTTPHQTVVHGSRARAASARCDRDASRPLFWQPGVSCLRVLVLAFPLAGCEGMQSVMDPVSRDAYLMAQLGWWMFAAAIFVFIVTIGLLGVAIMIRHGDKKGVPSFRFSTGLVVAGGVLAPLTAIIAVVISGVLISDETEGDPGLAGPVIEVTGRQWWWEFRYLNDNGETVAVTANEMHLPVGRRARIKLISDDVIHSFWVPNMQGKTDLIPGQTNILYAEPAQAGRWRGQCAEFCGLQHALMGLLIVAEPTDAYDAWLDHQARPAVVTDHPGLDVFVEQNCSICHTVRGTRANGTRGPDLTHVASRATLAAATLPNTRGNMGGWITSTHSVKPGVAMPATAPPPDDLMALLDFLDALE